MSLDGQGRLRRRCYAGAKLLPRSACPFHHRACFPGVPVVSHVRCQLVNAMFFLCSRRMPFSLVFTALSMALSALFPGRIAHGEEVEGERGAKYVAASFAAGLDRLWWLAELGLCGLACPPPALESASPPTSTPDLQMSRAAQPGHLRSLNRTGASFIAAV